MNAITKTQISKFLLQCYFLSASCFYQIFNGILLNPVITSEAKTDKITNYVIFIHNLKDGIVYSVLNSVRKWKHPSL